MPTPRTAHIAAAALDQTVGDWSGNARRIVEAIEEARRRGARLLLTPELSLTGYSLGDRVLRSGTLEHAWGALQIVLPYTTGIVVLVGLPIRHRGVLFNAVAVLADGKVHGITAKENLATGDLEYENRWYAGWQRGHVERWEAPDGSTFPIGSLLFEAPGIGLFGIEVCEDAWRGSRPGTVTALAGATLLLNPSATWFVLGKQAQRRRMIAQISDEDLAVYLFASLLGCDDTRMIFDGAVLLAQEGAILEEGPRFVFARDVVVTDRVVDLDGLVRRRMTTGSWRQQVEALHRGEMGPIPELVAIPGDFSTSAPAPVTVPYWTRGTTEPEVDASLAWLHRDGLIGRPPTSTDIPHLELELGLCIGMRDYLRKTGIGGVTLALSGGRDSTMCALVVHRMSRYQHPNLGPDALRAHMAKTFTTVWMDTENSSKGTRDAASAVANEIGATHLATSIQSAFDLHVKLAGDLMGETFGWDDPKDDLPLQNVQARLRSSLVWMVANVKQQLLITTSNLSEAAVGYCTMDGDTSGGLAPICNVPKSLVGSWLVWAARFHGYSSVESVFVAPATAELRPLSTGQTDEGDLMPFFVLDQLMFGFVQRGQDPIALFRSLWPSLQAHYGGDATAFAAHIAKFVRKLCQAQWKRERFAISFRVTAFDLDPKTGFRFPPVQAPFTEELAELDAYVASL